MTMCRSTRIWYLAAAWLCAANLSATTLAIAESPPPYATADPELRVVIDNTVEDFRYESANLVTDTAAVATRRGDNPQQALVALAGAGFDNVVHGAGFMRMQLVDDAQVDVESVQRATFRAERLEFRPLH